MSDEALLPCIVCGVRLRNVMADCINQPGEGTAFQSGGHYGSTFFDPMDGQEIEIVVCDACLNKNRDRIGWRRAFTLVQCGGTVVGKILLDRPLLPYTGPDENDAMAYLDVEPDQLGTVLHQRVCWYPSTFEFARRCYESEPAT